MTEAYRLHGYAAARGRSSRRPKPAPVTTVRVSPVVMTEALRLAEGDAARLSILSATTVLVRNNP
jgi:hypothetical protein